MTTNANPSEVSLPRIASVCEDVTFIRNFTDGATDKLVVFDSRIEALERLYDALLPGVTGYTIDEKADALEVITRLLGETGADELAIVAHGETGAVYIGAGPVTLERIQKQAHLLKEWRVREIALYSCEVGIDREFIARLERATGARIVSAIDKIGNAEQGGSWAIDDLTDTPIFDPGTLIDYRGVLAVNLTSITGINSTDTFINLTETENLTVNLRTTLPTSAGEDVLVAVYATGGTTLLYWSILDTSNNPTPTITFTNFKTNLGTYEGGILFRFWQGTYGTGALNSGNYTGTGKTLPNAATFGVNAVVAGGTAPTGSNISSSSPTYTLDTVAPAATVNGISALGSDTGSSATDFITRTAAQNITGTFTGVLGSGESIQVSANGGTSWVKATTSGQNWTASGVTLQSGTRSITTKTIDPAGNIVAGTSRSYTLDTVAPTANVNLISPLGSDTGASATDFVTSVASQTIGGTFTGIVAAGESIQVSVNGGASWLTPTTSGQNWAITGATLQPGNNTLTTRTIDLAGNIINGSSRAYTLDTLAPTAIVNGVSALGGDTGASTADFITRNAAQNITGTFTGTLGAAESIRVSANGGTSWVTAGISGQNWTANGVTLQPGSNTIITMTIDLAGNLTAGSSRAYTLDTVAPTATVNGVSSLSNDLGSSSTDFLTCIASQTIRGTFTGGLGVDESIQVSANGGTSWITAATSGQNWTAAGVTLQSGTRSITTRTIDLAGNIINGSSRAYTLDTVAPTATVNTISALSSDTGASSTDFITRIGSQNIGGTFTGTLGAGESIRVSLNGGTTWITPTLIGQNWTAGGVTLQPGNNSITTMTIDAAGNVTVGSSRAYNFDTTAPIAPGITLTNDAGISNRDNITNNGAITLTGLEVGVILEYSADNGRTWTGSFTPSEGDNRVQVRQTDLAGNVSNINFLGFSLDITPPVAPEISLTNDTGISDGDNITNNGAITLNKIEADTIVEYSTDDGQTWTGRFTASSGNNRVRVRQTDMAGNVSAIGSLVFTVDTTAPIAPNVSLVSDTGISSDDRITKNGAITLTGLETSASLEYSTDNGRTWTGNFTAPAGNNSLQVRQRDSAGNLSNIGSLDFTLDTTVPVAPNGMLTNDTGNSDNDGITSDGSLTLSGVETDASVEYSVDDGNTWTASFTPSPGNNKVRMRQTDRAGNISAMTSLSFVLDTTAPVAPTVALLNDTGGDGGDNITNTGIITLSGIETKASVEYSTDNAHTWTNSFVASEGDNKVRVRQTDVAGNVSNVGSLNFTLDTIAPAAPDISLTSDTGADRSDNITNDGSITLARIEKDTLVEYSLDNGVTWGNSFTPSVGVNRVRIRQTGRAGNASDITSFSFTLDNSAPVAPAIALIRDTGISNTDNITNDGNISLTAIEPRASVEYTVDNGRTWTDSFVASEGNNKVRVRQTDVAGNVSAIASLDFTLDTIAPVTPEGTLLNDTGSSSGDNISSDGTINITRVEAGATLEYSVDNGRTWTDNFSPSEGDNRVGVRQKDVAGNVSDITALAFTLDSTKPLTPNVRLTDDTGASGSDRITSRRDISLTGIETNALVEYSTDEGVTWTNIFAARIGVNKVRVRQTDMAGNVSLIAPLTFTLDITAPVAPDIALTNDDGTSNSDNITNDGSITASRLEAGAIVQYSIDGGGTWTDTFTASPGNNRVGVRQTDAAGNISDINSLTFTLDTTPPLTPTVKLRNDTGTSNSDNITSDGTLTLGGIETGAIVQYSIDGGETWTDSYSTPPGRNTVRVRQTDVAGNTSGIGYLVFTLNTNAVVAPDVALTNDTGISNGDNITADGSITLSRIETDAIVEYSVDNGRTWTDSFTASASNNSLQVRQTDVAGNTSGVGSLIFTLDTTAPAAPGLSLKNDTGSNSGDGITNDGKLDLTAIETGAIVEYSINGGLTWTNTFAAAEGNNSVRVRQTDRAGNISRIAALTLILDTAAPVAPDVALTSDTGADSSDNITNNGSLTLKRIEGGAIVEYSVDDGRTWATTFTAAPGENRVRVRQTDVAGNISPIGSLTFILNIGAVVAPNIALTNDTGADSSDKITSDGALTLTGVTTNAIVEYSTDNGQTWTYSFVAAEGVNRVGVRQTDVAGNISSIGSLIFTLDTAAPVTPDISLTNDTGFSSIDNITADGSLALSRLETGAKVEYSSDDGQTWKATFTAARGENRVRVRQTDVAGNISPVGSLTFILDITAPVAPGVVLTADTGISNSDNITNNAALTLSGLEANAKLEYSTDDGRTWTDGFNAVEGNNILRVRQTDVAGNVSPAGTIVFTLDTGTITPVLSLASDSGSLENDRITNSGTVNVNGLETGAVWQYSTNGGGSWSTGTGNSFTLSGDGPKNAIVRQTDAAGNNSLNSAGLGFTLDTTIAEPIVALANDSGISRTDGITNSGVVNVSGLEAGAIWQYSTDGGNSWITGTGNNFPLTGDGTKNIIVRQTDIAGNTASRSSSFTLDTTTTTPTITRFSNPGNNVLTLTGTAEANSRLAINYSGTAAGSLAQVTVDSNGNWNVNTPTLANGIYTFKVTATDVAGNGSTTLTSAKVGLPLTATDDEVQILNNSLTSILASSLFNNDKDPVTTNTLSLLGVTNPVNGTVRINSSGNVIFTPNANFIGEAGFTYTMQNNLGLTATANVKVNVNPRPTLPMGININSVSDWVPQLPFIDVFKFSRPWLWEGPYTAITTNLDANGWLTSVTPPAGVTPTALPATVIFSDLTNRYPSGRYIVLYEGQGSITYRFAATKNVALSTPGRDVIDVNSATAGGIFLRLTSTDPNKTGNYMRNIRIVPEQYENTHTNFYNQQIFNPSTAQMFNPTLMSRITPFPTVRFMDWIRTNNSGQANWTSRPTLNQAQWSTGNGTPVEAMVALANQGNFNPWFTIPHIANDDYVRQFAQYVKDNLAPDRKIYVEYTNEAWNGVFAQYSWITNQAKAVGLNNMQWYALRTAQVINIWKDVFGARSNQIVGVLGAQAANVGGTASPAITYLKNTNNISAIDAIAIAPYFGGYLGDPLYASQVQNLTLNNLFDELTQGGIVRNSSNNPVVPGGALERSYGWMQNYINLSKQNNLQLLAYEAGQHLTGFNGAENNNAMTNLFIAANRDARMGQLYQQYLFKWNQLGGGLLMNYEDLSTPTKWGSFGLMEHLNDINNPKYTSVLQMLQSR